MPGDVPRETRFLVPFTDRDQMRVHFSRRRGKVVDVVVQLECLIGEEWRHARRYDTHMGLHVHTAPWDPVRDRIEPLGDLDLNAALSLAIGDINANWERYRAACEGA